MQIILLAAIPALLVVAFLIAYIFRRVVPTDEVHIVQSSRKRTLYGGDLALKQIGAAAEGISASGNSYYEWPTQLPYFGVTKTVMKLSVFDLKVNDYEAYDSGRLPFVVDVVAFFRITDARVASERVSNFDELKRQLDSIVRGAIRSILATHDIEEIMQDRSKFGETFTSDIKDNVASWGVDTVKSIELMDIRDTADSQVIFNIMEKKKSSIERESRVVVAENMKVAEISEIEAKREQDLAREEAEQAVGIRTAEKEKQVGIATQRSEQEVKDQEIITTKKQVAVDSAKKVGEANIARDVATVEAEQHKETLVIKSNGDLEATKLSSEGIRVDGEARAAAEQAKLMAPVNAQKDLAVAIANLPAYQQYLLGIESIAALKIIGAAQAEALREADLKVLVNSGDASNGVDKLTDILSGKGGQGIVGMLESLNQSGLGEGLLKRFGVKIDGQAKAATATDGAANVQA